MLIILPAIMKQTSPAYYSVNISELKGQAISIFDHSILAIWHTENKMEYSEQVRSEQIFVA
jgi:hypothetical protein